MTDKARRLLESIRASKSGKRRSDLERLYKAFGFIIEPGSKHDIVKHPKYPMLRTTLGRHRDLATGYFTTAVFLIDELIRIQEKEKLHGQ